MLVTTNLLKGVGTFAHTVQKALETRHIWMSLVRVEFVHEVLHLVIYIALRLNDLLLTIVLKNISIFPLWQIRFILIWSVKVLKTSVFSTFCLSLSFMSRAFVVLILSKPVTSILSTGLRQLDTPFKTFICLGLVKVIILSHLVQNFIVHRFLPARLFPYIVHVLIVYLLWLTV